MNKEEKNLDFIVVDDFVLKQLELLGLDVNKFTEKKKNLTYLSWSHAWEEFIKVFPKATYHVRKDIEGNAFFGKPNIGYMVFTTVKAMDIEREMWLLVMDSANKALKDEPYTYEVANYVWDNVQRKRVKEGTIEKKVGAIDMFDINKTIMRCLVKNLAMFGLGLYVYKGEDLPTDTTEYIKKEEAPNIPPKTEEKPKGKTTPPISMEANTKETMKPVVKLGVITDKQIARIHILMEESGANKTNIYTFFDIKTCKELDTKGADEMINMLTGIKKKQNGNVDATQISQIVALLKKTGFSKKGLLKKYDLKDLDSMLYKDANVILEGLRKLPSKS